jgi:putative ABC transport system permease protein
MNFERSILLSFRQLFINRSTTIFAIIGLSVGVASVITMVSIGNGAKKAAIDQLEKTGTNLIVINAGKVKKVVQRRDKSDLVTTLRMKDCEAIVEGCQLIKVAVPSLDGVVKVKYGSIITKCMINGVSSPYFKIKNFTIGKGNVFSPVEDQTFQRVTVLGGQVSKTLFGNEDPVGEILFIDRIPFTVVGVLKSKGVTADGANEDAQVLIPINTALRRIFNSDYLRRIVVETRGRDEMKLAETEVVSILRKAHRLDAGSKENDFTVNSQLSDIEAIESSSRSFTWLIAGVSTVALLVGGIGILAVMLLSVKERNEEIGLRIALGARRKDIVNQFLAESVMLGLAGGITGFVTGFAASEIIKYTSQWNISLTYGPVIGSLLFSIIIGLVAGVLPAGKASQANPISALQKE